MKDEMKDETLRASMDLIMPTLKALLLSDKVISIEADEFGSSVRVHLTGPIEGLQFSGPIYYPHCDDLVKYVAHENGVTYLYLEYVKKNGDLA